MSEVYSQVPMSRIVITLFCSSTDKENHMEFESNTLIRISVRCETGTRENNEDCYFANSMLPAYAGATTNGIARSYEAEGKLLCGVFDGMGGRAYGEEASFSASSKISKAYSEIKDECWDADTILETCMREGCSAVTDKSIEFGGCRMGTTSALLYIDGRVAYTANLGDSRIYMYSEDTLTQLSHDDNERQCYIEARLIPPRHSESRLTAFMGMSGWRSGEYNQCEPIPLHGGEKFLLCSDGLSSFLDESRITQILSECDNPEDAVNMAVSEAAERSNDNITAVAVYVLNVKDPITFNIQDFIAQNAITL